MLDGDPISQTRLNWRECVNDNFVSMQHAHRLCILSKSKNIYSTVCNSAINRRFAFAKAYATQLQPMPHEPHINLSALFEQVVVESRRGDVVVVSAAR